MSPRCLIIFPLMASGFFLGFAFGLVDDTVGWFFWHRSAARRKTSPYATA